jgi:probable phosphoglycerate mutase
MSGYPQRPFTVPPDATELVLVRHGATAHAIPGEPFPLRDGHGDPPLAEAGEAQALAVAERLAGETDATLFTSGLLRTTQTAAPLAARLGRTPTEVHALREVMLGEWEGGELRIRMAHGDPIALRVLEEERWDVIPGAESADGFAERLRRGVDEIVTQVGAGAAAIVFVHGGVVGELCRQATDSRPFAFVHADNGSITRLVVFPGGRWLLRSFNDTAHLR